MEKFEESRNRLYNCFYSKQQQMINNIEGHSFDYKTMANRFIVARLSNPA